MSLEERQPAPPSTSPATEAPPARRPPGYIGPAGLGLGFVGAVVSVMLGLPAIGVLAVAASLLGGVETSNAFDGWLIARRLRGHPVEVRRQLFGRASLLLPTLGPQARATRKQALLAAVNDRLWVVQVPVAIDFALTIERRSLLSGRGVVFDDPPFDKGFVVTAPAIDGSFVVHAFTPPARAALVRLFMNTAVSKVAIDDDGLLTITMKRRRDDPSPVSAGLKHIEALVAELAKKPTTAPSIAALRAHSPDGNPFGVG